MAAAVAAAANTIAYLIEITVTPAIVLSATILSLTLAGVVTWLLTRWKAALRTALAWSGLAVGIGTIPVPLLSAPQTATGWTLATMHLIAGFTWFASMSINTRRPRAESRRRA